jgi:putative membrane protein
MFNMHDIGWGGWLLLSIGVLAFWALIVYGITILVRGNKPTRRADRPDESPGEIIKRRLARREISIDQYEQLRATIREQSSEKAAA